MTGGKIEFHSRKKSYLEIKVTLKDYNYRLILVNHWHDCGNLSYGYRLFHHNLEEPRQYEPIDRQLFYYNIPPIVLNNLWDKIILIE